MDLDTTLVRIKAQAIARAIRVTDHAREGMEAEFITLAEVLEAIKTSQIIENYQDHKRGACCLLFGLTSRGRPLHVVCTTSLPSLVIITVYVPAPPKWISPKERRPK